MKAKQEFMTILADGSMRLPATDTTPNAVKREYETSDGKTGTKWELVYKELSGIISKVSFFTGDYGKLLQLTITDGEEETVLSVSTTSNYGEDIMKKLPNIKMDQEVKFVPYSFEDEKTKKNKKGVTIYQAGEKIENFYYDKESKKNLYGYPTPEIKKGEPWDNEDWKLYFGVARKFLVNEVTKRFVREETEEVTSVVEETSTNDDSDFGDFADAKPGEKAPIKKAKKK